MASNDHVQGIGTSGKDGLKWSAVLRKVFEDTQKGLHSNLSAQSGLWAGYIAVGAAHTIGEDSRYFSDLALNSLIVRVASRGGTQHLAWTLLCRAVCNLFLI